MKRGKPLARRTPLKRKTWMRARSKTSKYSQRPRDLDYMAKVRRLPCVVRAWARILWRGANAEAVVDPWSGPDSNELRKVLYNRHGLWCMPVTTCSGRVQADHAGARTLGQKCPDDETISLCRHHHQERTDYTGTFKNFNAEEMRAWCDWAIAVTYHEISTME